MLRNIGFRSHKKNLRSSGIIEKKITENNSIPLEEILSEETVIEELQSGNKILVKYLNKEKVKQMIDYIIKEPPDDTNFEKGHKYPWICSQLFNIENSEILKYFYKTNKELDSEEAEGNENKMEIEYDKNKENKIELLDYLLTFLTSNNEPNYVLCGYFASLIKTLLNSKSTLIIKYFYKENKDFIKKLIKYSYRESISEILNRIFQYDMTVEEFNIEEMDLTRMEILEGLFSKIDIDMDNEKLDSISTLIKNLSTEENLFSDLLNNRKIIHSLITKPLKNINLIIEDKSQEMQINNKRRNFIIIIDIIINWIKAINSLEIDLPSTIDESEDDNINEEIINNDLDRNFSHTLLSYELFNVLSNLIKTNFNKNDNNNITESKILQCFDEKEIIPLGLFRIKIVELLGNLFFYFKKIPNLYDKLLIDSKFFENAINYIFDYEFNNIYQDSLLFLFKKYLNYSEFHPILSEFLFTKLNIMNIIISKIKITEESEDSNIKKDCFVFSSGNTTHRGYVSFLISLAYKINTIIGGDPLRLNDTLSREGSISFINRATPFVAKEEITKFYGMEENELYEQVSNESDEVKRESKLNCSVKCMEKYLNENWNEFFYEHISDKIKLYETKLFKDDNRDSIFRNPFILENDDENMENRQNNFGLGDDEDVLKEKTKKPDFNKILYGDEDMDFNMGNRFKMSMRLPRSSNNNINERKKRGSWGSKPMQSKVVVDEIENFDNNKDEEKKDNIEEKEENEEEENPLDKFKRNGNEKNNNDMKDEENEEEENPLDKFKRNGNEKNNNDMGDEENEEEDPFAKFTKKDKDRNTSLVSFRKKKTEEIEIKDDSNEDKINDKIDKKEEEENPLDKLKQDNNLKQTENKEEKMDLDNEDLYADSDEDEDVFKKDNKEEQENKDEIKNNKEENNFKNDDNKIDEDDLYEDSDENDSDSEEKEEINPLDIFKQENKNKEENINKEEQKNKEEKKVKEEKKNKEEKNKIKVDLIENPFDSIRQEKPKPQKEEEEEEEEDEEEEEEEDEEENPIDKFKRENKYNEVKREENPLDNKNENNEIDKDKEKKDDIDDLLYESREEDDYEEEEEEEDDDEDNKEFKDKK